MTIIIEKVRSQGKDKIFLTFPYNPDLVTKANTVPGASFSKEGGAHWAYPLDMRICRMLREAFGADLKVGPALVTWSREAVKREAEMHALSSADDADLLTLPAVAPVLAQAMAARTYQRVGARFVAQGRTVLIADQPGLGKTLEAIGGIIESGLTGPVLILSLKTAMGVVWEAELLRWLPNPRVTVAPEGKVKRAEALEHFWLGVHEDPDSLHFLICNPEMIRVRRDEVPGQKGKWTYTPAYPSLFDTMWDGVVIDESAHKQCSLISPSNTEAKMSQFRLGAKRLPIADNGVKIALSGTPMRGKPHKLWGTLNWLQPAIYTSYWKWVARYWKLEQNDYTGNASVIGELQHPDKLHDDLRGIMLRRTKAEVLKDLPPKQYGGTPLDPADPSSPVGVWVPLTPEQAKAYKAMEDNAAVALEGGSLMANGALAELTRLKQFANTYGYMDGGTFVPSLPSNKFDTVVEMLAERGIYGKANKPENDDNEGDSQVVIGSQFTATINLFAKGLQDMGIEVAVLTGATSQKERTRLINEFQGEGGPRVFLINTNAGGVAVTLDRADDLFILDETWIPDDQEQLEDRIHRASRIHQVNIYYIRSLGTIEEYIARLNVDADDLQKHLLDQMRGVRITRMLLGMESVA